MTGSPRSRSTPPRRGAWDMARADRTAILALAINLAGNARTGLWDRDEPRYAVGRPRDARTRRLDLPDFQRRAAISQADPDLLADGPDDGRWRATTRSARGWSRRSPAPRRCSASGGWAGGCSARGGGLLAALDLRDGADRGRRIEAGDDRRDPGALAARAARRASGCSAGDASRSAAALFWILPEPGHPDQGAGRARADRRVGALAWWWGWPVPRGSGSTGDGDWPASWS